MPNTHELFFPVLAFVDTDQARLLLTLPSISKAFTVTNPHDKLSRCLDLWSSIKKSANMSQRISR
jgi:hypothetical protein